MNISEEESFFLEDMSDERNMEGFVVIRMGGTDEREKVFRY